VAEIRANLVSDVNAPAEARSLVAEVTSGMPAAFQEEAGLLVSELVSHSVLNHEPMADGTIGLHVAIDHDMLRVEVADHAERLARPSAHTAGGRFGLDLVDSVATDWGTEHRDGLGIVWFELRVPTESNGHR
jgi:hypothetical protein